MEIAAELVCEVGDYAGKWLAVRVWKIAGMHGREKVTNLYHGHSVALGGDQIDVWCRSDDFCVVTATIATVLHLSKERVKEL
jgi:hypothetical protein